MNLTQSKYSKGNEVILYSGVIGIVLLLRYNHEDSTIYEYKVETKYGTNWYQENGIKDPK